MVISYRKLWELLERRSIPRRDLPHLAGISTATVYNMQKGYNVNLDILRKICEALHVDIGDIVGFEEETDDSYSQRNDSLLVTPANHRR